MATNTSTERRQGVAEAKLILDYIYEHAEAHPQRILLTQPVGSGKVVDYTWSEVVDEAKRMAAYLQSQGFGAGSHIAVVSKNCAHFFIAELAIWMAGGTTVAIFPTESAETVRYVLEHSDSKLLFVGKLDNWPEQEQGVPAGMPCIALPLAPPTAFPKWDELITTTEPLPGRPSRKPDDLAILMYTSGSTGTPKGAMHNFGRISEAARLAAINIGNRMPSGVPWRILSYLPLAHVFERAVIECMSWVHGDVHIYFAESLDTFVADLQRARPTFFVSVPRLWLKFQQGVFAKVPEKKLNRLLSIPILGGMVRKKVLTGLGLDQVRLAFSGSAPIPAELITWYRKLGLQLFEGYGMTEDFAYSHASTEQAHEAGYVGVPFEGVEVRIGENDEVLIKSPGQMVGYYKRPDLNAEVFTSDGFFRTGDKGERRADGLLKLTGRVKEMFKTAKGKYVAPAPIENRLNEHPMVELSMVSGSGQSAAYAIVVLAEDLRDSLNDSAVRTRVENELEQLLKKVNAAIASYEQLQMLVISQEAWSIENGCLTPTMKIKRSHIESAVEDKVGDWYQSGKTVIWA
ncbi:MAG: AMP-binding protein [Betaproteobacteria bacterium]|nr:MAG: AMP-binding protein [Betaproteobacteria bacterium]